MEKSGKMEKQKKTKIPADAGVDSEWLVALAETKIKKPKEWTAKETKEMSAKKPESKIQGILQQFYWDLMDNMKEFKVTVEGEIIEEPDEDMFDKWYENMDLENYSQTYKLLQKFNTIARALHVKEETGYGSESDIQNILKRIANRCLQENEYIEKVKDVINEMYPGLANPFRSEPSTAEMNEQEIQEYEKRKTKLIGKIESNIEEFEEELAKIEAAKETEFEQIAQNFNQIIIFGESNWELLLYSIMSSYAPRVIINSLSYRSNLHTLLPGDISTAKSKILEIALLTSPKTLVVDKTTIASFEGVVKMGEDEIQEGVLDLANNGAIIVEELTKDFTRMPLFRRSMDCKYIQIFKGGKRKGITVNTTMLTACNPNDDFFIEETTFRKQIAFKEGVISRFDIMIPLTATQVKNELFIEKMNLFGEVEEPVDFDDIKSRLHTISTGMKTIRQVIITKEQQRKLKDAFKMHNETDKRRRILRNRPLLILRDLETLVRLVNTIASVNFSKREVQEHPKGDKVLKAADEDIEKAIQLWENLLKLRVELYARSNRNLLTVSDEIVLYIHQRQRINNESVPIAEIKNEFVNIRKLCARSTFYKEIKTLRETGRIVQRGERDGEVKVVVK